MESSHFVQYSAARGRFVVGGRGVVNGMENHKSGIASQGKKPDRQEKRGRQTNLKGVGGSISSLPAANIEGQGQSIVQMTIANVQVSKPHSKC